MSSIKDYLLLLIILLVNLGNVKSAKCYACTSWEQECHGLQNSETSPWMECTERYGGPCAQLHFNNTVGKLATIRFCLPMKELPNCDVIQHRVTEELKGWTMTNCTTCENDFCNGNSFV